MINFFLLDLQSLCYCVSMTLRHCDFCEIVAGRAPAKIEHEWSDAIAIHTIRPKTTGHLLVLPKKHVQDANEDPDLAAAVMKRAASIATPPAHINTNMGGAAAQTIFHLHYHIIPRRRNEEVRLSWFKPWDNSPLDRRCSSTPNERHGLSFSAELNITWKTLMMKTDLSLPTNLRKLLPWQND
jgi:histidine triad (HIT) family protein